MTRRAKVLIVMALATGACEDGVRTMVLGRDGTIWLAEEIGDSETTPWLVLGDEGETLGRVALPAELEIRRVDYPFLWGVETDELDVPYVVRYRITTPMIAMGDEESGATLSGVLVVAQPTPQDSRHGGDRPSTAIPDIS